MAKSFSLVALVVSALSFVASSGQTWLMYEHNRMSVMPKLDWRSTYGDKSGERLDVFLINAGLGPAKVSDLKIGVNNALYPMADGTACGALNDLLGISENLPDDFDCFAMADDDFAFVKPNDKLVLYTTGSAKDVNTGALDQLGVSAKYCSLYDQCENL